MRALAQSTIIFLFIMNCKGMNDTQHNPDGQEHAKVKDESLSFESPLQNKLTVEPSSPFCKSLNGEKLICDFESTKKNVYLEVQSRQKRDLQSPLYKSVEIKSASVFHLAESACMEDISIKDTKKVIVDNSYQRKEETEDCVEYKLSLINSTITSIPFTVTRLDVIRSTVQKLVTPPPLLSASINHSHVEVFTTKIPLRGRSVVNITSTKISRVEELKMTNNSTMQILSSSLTFTNVKDIHFQDNSSIYISNSSLISSQPLLFSVHPGVVVTLDTVSAKLIFKYLAGIVPSTNTNNKSFEQLVLKEPISQHKNYHNYFISTIVLAVACILVLSLFVFHFYMKLRPKHLKCLTDPEQNEIVNIKSSTESELNCKQLLDGIRKEEQSQLIPSTPIPKSIRKQTPGSSVKKREITKSSVARGLDYGNQK